MDQFYMTHRKPQESFPWYHQPYRAEPMKPSHEFTNSQYSSFHQTSFHNSIINKDPKTISNSELANLLDQHPKELKKMRRKNPQQQLPILMDFLLTVCHVPKSTLLSVAQHNFFSSLQAPFTNLLQRWCRSSSLTDDEISMFRSIVRLIKRFNKATDAVKLLPSWLLDSTFLNTIADCLTNIGTSKNFLNDKNNRLLKYFTRLIEIYTYYQECLDDENDSDKDTLVLLLDPILQCLTSSQYINTFTNLSQDKKSMTTIEKFFLLKCPSFFISYNGSRLQQTMEKLLSTMLPQYAALLDKVAPSAHNWKRSMIRSVQYLLKIIKHGANQFQINAKLVREHLPLINHVLTLLDEPIFYNNLQETLSNPETIFMNTASSFLVDMISEPTVLAEINRSHMTSAFLRLTSCEYEPLVRNVHTLIAYTTREEDIKEMRNPGQLLETIMKSLKTTLDQPLEDRSDQEQLLETLKGLVQHDQMKDEIIKQNAIPFLLECTNKLNDKAQILAFEILWSLTFHEEGALALRSNRNFLNKIQTISKNNNSEPLKKAVDGLVWKLVREPENLERMAKRQAEEQNTANNVMETIIEEIIDSTGQKQLVTRRISSVASDERIFQYDIMISYCHADKDLIYKIHKFLVDQGFKIWIDLNNMYGPAMNAMADAVENSEFIIMCMSDSYKRSTYCQAEAEYAFNCKRRLLPLIVREGYRPDGWLGFMIGSRIYVDFGRFDFNTACEKLMTEIRHQRKQPLPSKPVTISQPEKPTEIVSNKVEIVTTTHDHNALSMYMDRKSTSNFIRKYVNEWEESDVLDFLFTEHLNELMPICKTMDGQALIQLYGMCKSQSSQTFILLNDELKSTYNMKLPITVYARFLSAMEQKLAVSPLTPYLILSELPGNTVTTTSQEYISYTPKTSMVNQASLQYQSYADQPYDLTITSNTSNLQLLKALEYHDSNLKKLISI